MNNKRILILHNKYLNNFVSVKLMICSIQRCVTITVILTRYDKCSSEIDFTYLIDVLNSRCLILIFVIICV